MSDSLSTENWLDFKDVIAGNEMNQDIFRQNIDQYNLSPQQASYIVLWMKQMAHKAFCRGVDTDRHRSNLKLPPKYPPLIRSPE